MSNFVTIAKVSAETGIAKEVLRKWEERYGFPTPVRDDAGNRLYPEAQVRRLALVRRLIDSGMRPSQVVSLEEQELACLAEQVRGDDTEAHAALSHVVEWLRTRDPMLIRDNLRAELEKSGLKSFVMDVMPAMNIMVGNGWANGALAVRDEHLYTEIVQNMLRDAMGKSTQQEDRPRILLATTQGEAHVLGILMVEALMRMEGACCISLGPLVPEDELAPAGQNFRADVLALSFSEHFAKKRIPSILKQIRAQLPAETELWAGGAGVKGIQSAPRGVSIFTSIAEAVPALERCRKKLGLAQ